MTAKSVHFAANLPQLQNLMKRDPLSYQDEFLKQWQYYHSLMQTFQLQPNKYNERLNEIITFIAQVSHCYKEEVTQFPEQLGDLLKNYSTVLDRTMRMTLVKALIMLRNKELIPATQVLQLFFKLLRCEDKLLRKTVYQYIVSDIKNVNAKHKNAKLNAALQNFMFSMLQESNAVTVKTALDIMIELFRRGIWKDAKTVNVITTACFSKITKVMVAAIKFFLGSDEENEKDKDSSDSDDDDDDPKRTAKELVLGHRVGKKTRKRKRKLDRALLAVNKHKKKKNNKEVFDSSAHHLIHDPQGFSEKLFRQLEKSTERFEVKLMMIDLISRMIGIHKLVLLNFYPFMKRFLQPHQREVTRLLLYLAQGSHEVVPPDTMEEILMTIANNFITERNSGEVMAVGLNAVREICARCPLAMTEDLLQDLTQYKSHKDKAVFMGARSLVQLFRQENRKMLHRKDRGRATESQKELKILQYGETDAKSYIAGAEVIPDRLEKETTEKKDQDDWESASEEEDEGGDDNDWVTVQHSSDEEQAEETITPEELAEKQKIAEEVSATRIMTDEDFKAIEMQQISKELPFAKAPGAASKARKRKREEDNEKSKTLPSLGDIEMVHKKRMHDKESRLSTVMAGREGRDKFTHGPQKMNPYASTSNKDKTKKKAFSMVKHKIRRGKVKRSFKEKQVALRNSLLKKSKNSKF